MVAVIIHADCANSPKKLLLRDLNIAFARADVEAILTLISDDIIWHRVGDSITKGKDAMRQALEAMKDTVAAELRIHSIITHGREGTVKGIISTAEGKSYAFCDVCQFTSTSGTQIKSMTSYTIEITDKE